jgi:hypothetical protein
MKIKTAELTGAALNWAAAKAEGRVLREPVRATDADLARMAMPCQLWEVVCTTSGDKESWSVEPIKVIRFGVDRSVGAISPSISFIDRDGIEARGSVVMFFLSREEAELAAQVERVGGLENFSPSTNWAQGGPIIDREMLDVLYMGNGIDQHEWRVECIGGFTFAEGPTSLIAAMRCFVADKLGAEVDVPDALITPPSPARAPAPRRPRI